MIDRRRAGSAAETLAAKRLKRCGYRIVARNWRCRYGELDIAAIKDGHLVVVEVKSGVGELPYENIHRRKQRRLRLLAQAFADSHGLLDMPVRFDAALVDLSSRRVEIIEDAF
ncbi:MAG TPA: YraN family protein [Proteobacteria bacterium]|nr:YraN family protein [Pseudomonadota bacterium]